MYSGTTFTKYSGRILGAHQKLDSVARRNLTKLGVTADEFPSIRKILHFEGKNGPDAIKRKSPAQDEPWHYFDPFNKDDTQLVELIEDHYKRLVKDLKAGNEEKSAFEAAWLAHAITDGLTPAHHYPYEEKLVELRGGKGIETRTTYKEKLIMHGETRRIKLKNNWGMWGPRGLFTAHAMFEMGVATMIKPLGFSDTVPSEQEIATFKASGVGKAFVKAAREIAVLDTYHHYIEKGWTPKLAWQVRHRLAPIIIQTVTLAWYSALNDAGKL